MHDPISKSIRRHLEAMARAIGWWQLLRAIGVFVFVFLVACVLIATIDWWLRSDLPLMRWSLSLLLLAVTAVLLSRVLWPALRPRPELLWIVDRLEESQSLEQARGDLTAGVSLALAPVPRQSNALTRTVIDRTWSKLQGTSVSTLLNWPAIAWPMAAASIIIAVVVVISLVSPSLFGVATMRLFNPAGSYRWPTRYELVFEEFPSLVAAEQPAVLVVANRRRRSPAEVRLMWEALEESSFNGSVVARLQDGVYRFELPGFATDVRVRALAGDGDTGWRRLRVTAAPQVNDWIVTALPPACLGQPARTLGTHALVPSNSVVSMVGSVTTPITRATLQIVSAKDETKIPLSIASDGLSFRWSNDALWNSSQDCTYAIEVVGIDGLVGRSETRELVIVPNPPPQILWTDDELRVDEQVLLTHESRWPIELEFRDDQGVAEILIEWASPASDSPMRSGDTELEWLPLWKDSPEELSQEATSNRLNLELSADAFKALTSEATDSVLVRASAIDRCGARANSPPIAVRVVISEVYLSGLQSAWDQWLIDAQTWTDSIADYRRAAEILSETTSTEGERGSAQNRVVRWVDQWRGGPSSLSGRLARIERLLERHALAGEPLGQLLSRTDRELAEIQVLIDRQLERYQATVRLANSSDPALPSVPATENDLNLWASIIGGWNEIESRLSDVLRSERLPDWERWSRELTSNLESQIALRQESLDLIGSAESDPIRLAAIRTLADRQWALSIGLERLEQEVIGEVERSTRAAWLLEQLREYSPAIWQREAAGKLQANQIGPASEAQRSAIEALQTILDRGQQSEINEDPQQAFHEATRRMAAISQDLGLTQRIAQELQAWRAIDPSLSNEERRERLSQRLRAQAQRLNAQARRMVEQSGEYDLPRTLEEASTALNEASQEIANQQAEAAQAALDQAIEQLQLALEQAGESVAATQAGQANSSDPTQSNQELGDETSAEEASIEATLLAWIERERGIHEELAAPIELAPTRESFEAWGEWLRAIAHGQEGLRNEIDAALSRIEFEQRPVLQSELRSIMTSMSRLEGELARTASVCIEQKSFEPEAVAAHALSAEKIAERLLYLAYEPPPRTTQEEQPGLSDPNQSNNEESSQKSLPGYLRNEIARLRMAESELLTQVEELDPTSSDVQRVQQLAERQRELERLAAQLGELIKQASTESENEGPANPRLPGLPGQSLPGLPGNNALGSDDGEDLGEAQDPWEEIVVGMDEAALRLARGDDSPVTQGVMRRVVDALDSWLGGAPSPSEPPSGSAGTMGSSVAGVESAVQSQGTAPLLLSIDQLRERSSGVWGHLPEQLQESLQGISGDGWIQGFEDVSSHYFSELSGQED